MALRGSVRRCHRFCTVDTGLFARRPSPLEAVPPASSLCSALGLRPSRCFPHPETPVGRVQPASPASRMQL